MNVYCVSKQLKISIDKKMATDWGKLTTATSQKDVQIVEAKAYLESYISKRQEIDNEIKTIKDEIEHLRVANFELEQNNAKLKASYNRSKNAIPFYTDLLRNSKLHLEQFTKSSKDLESYLSVEILKRKVEYDEIEKEFSQVVPESKQFHEKIIELKKVNVQETLVRQKMNDLRMQIKLKNNIQKQIFNTTIVRFVKDMKNIQVRREIRKLQELKKSLFKAYEQTLLEKKYKSHPTNTEIRKKSNDFTSTKDLLLPPLLNFDLSINIPEVNFPAMNLQRRFEKKATDVVVLDQVILKNSQQKLKPTDIRKSLQTPLKRQSNFITPQIPDIPIMRTEAKIKKSIGDTEILQQDIKKPKLDKPEGFKFNTSRNSYSQNEKQRNPKKGFVEVLSQPSTPTDPTYFDPFMSLQNINAKDVNEDEGKDRHNESFSFQTKNEKLDNSFFKMSYDNTFGLKTDETWNITGDAVDAPVNLSPPHNEQTNNNSFDKMNFYEKDYSSNFFSFNN